MSPSSKAHTCVCFSSPGEATYVLMRGVLAVSWVKERWLLSFPLAVLMWRTSTLLSSTNLRGALSVSWMTVLCLPPCLSWPAWLAGQLWHSVLLGHAPAKGDERSFQHLDILQICRHLRVLCMVLPSHLSCDQLWITLHHETLRAHLFGQEHSSYQRLVFSLVIACFEGEA